MLKVIFVIFAYCVTFTGCLVWTLTQPSPFAYTAMTIIALSGTPAIAAAAFHYVWRPMLEPYSWIEPTPDAVCRRFQSFSIGYVNMGMSIHVAADDEHLHLTPLSIWRLLGATPASIPWSELKKVGPRSAMLGVNRLFGPRWVIDLIGED